MFATQRVDPEHPALGATVAKIAAVAARVDEVVVLADGAVPGSLPDNVTVRTFGARSRLGRGAGFPLPSHKVVATGHGIDVSRFRCGRAASGRRLLALGRYSPAKGLETIVRAVAAVPEAELDVYGPTLTDEERRHRGELEQLVEDVGAGERVRLRDAVPPSEVPQLLTAADALVNNMRAGAPDKVVYEAAASCLPVLASNPVFDTLLPAELRFERGDAAGLAERIRALPELDPGIGTELRRRVEAEHSVDRWAERVLAAASRVS